MQSQYTTNIICPKIVILENQESNYIIKKEFIRELQKNNYEVLICQSIKEITELLKTYLIDLIIMDFEFLEEINEYLEIHSCEINKIFIHEENKKIDTIILLTEYEYDKFFFLLKNNHLKNMPLDYFIKPFDFNFLLNRIFYVFNNKKEKICLLQKNLKTYLLESQLYNQEKLHTNIWKNEYNFYILSKYIQYNVYFSNIFYLIEDFFLEQKIAFDILLKRFLNLINLQMCFFNCYITFITNKGIIPKIPSYNHKFFFLFLIYISEVLKTKNISTEITLDFIKNGRNYLAIVSFQKNIKDLIYIYNNMYIETTHLYQYIQQYLWKHWKKKIPL